MSEYVVDFGDKSTAFVGLAMAEAESHGATLMERVVRCRDCRWCMAYSKVAYCDRFAHALPTAETDGFCAWGERRSDDRDR